MMAAQDENAAPWGACVHQREDCDNHITAARYWNEVVMDKYLMPWDPDVTSMIDAVAISPRASSASMAYARHVHGALARLFASRDAAAPPLLYYDAASTGGNPFTFSDVGDQ